MKKTTAILLGTLIASSAALAQTSNVLSRNAVGYVKSTVAPGKLAMLRNDFVPMNSNTQTPSVIFGSTLPVGTKVYFWNAGTSTYSIEEYKITVGPPPLFLSTTNWSPNTAVMDQGVGAWVQIPGSLSESVDVYFMGEVPDNAEKIVNLLPGLNMVSYPYPVAETWENTSLAQNAEVGDKIYIWDSISEGYVIGEYKVTVGPPPLFLSSTNWTPAGIEIPVGAGFWYQTGSGKTWTESKPYQWP